MPGPNDRISILIADDEPDARRDLKNALNRAFPSATIMEAADGADALRRLGIQPIDMVFICARLPRMDGYGVLKRVETLVKQNRPKTAVLMGDENDRGSIPGEWTYLPFLAKPMAPAALAEQLKRAFDPAILKAGIKPRVGAQGPAPASKAESGTLTPAELTQQRALANSSAFLEPFLVVALDVLCKNGKVPAKRDRIYLRGHNEASGDFSFVQSMGNSEVAVSYAISFDNWTLLTYSGGLLGKTYTEFTPEFHSAFTKLCQAIIVGTQARLAERGQKLDLGVLEIHSARGHGVPHVGAQGACVALRFQTPHGHFTLEVVVDRNPSG